MTPTTLLQALNAIRLRVIAATTLTDQQVWIGKSGSLGFGGPAIAITDIAETAEGRVRRGAVLEERRRLVVQMTASGDAIPQLDIAARDLAGGDALPDLAFRAEGARRSWELRDAGAALAMASVTQTWARLAASPAAAFGEAEAVSVGLDYGIDGEPLDELATNTFDMGA